MFQIFLANFTFRSPVSTRFAWRALQDIIHRFYQSEENADCKVRGRRGKGVNPTIVPAAVKTVTTSSFDSIMEERLG